jgi:hypothetical protein
MRVYRGLKRPGLGFLMFKEAHLRLSSPATMVFFGAVFFRRMWRVGAGPI